MTPAANCSRGSTNRFGKAPIRRSHFAPHSCSCCGGLTSRCSRRQRGRGSFHSAVYTRMEDSMSNVSRRDFIIASGAGVIGAGAIGCGGGSSQSQKAVAAVTRLTVLVRGLVGTVSKDGATYLLLVDGDATLKQPHRPRLYAAAGTPSSGISPDGTDDGRLFRDLKNHRVTLTSGVTTGTTKVTNLRRPGEEEKPNADGQSHRDVTWVAQMAKIPGAGTGTINPHCLDDDPSPFNVSSRVRFNGGEFAARFRNPFHGVVWQFAGSGTSQAFRQALGELTYSQVIQASNVVFKLEPFQAGPPREIILAATTGANLEVEIGNRPTMEACNNPSDANNLAHFAAFYQLLSPAATATPIPACQSNCPGCPAGGEIVYCPPADYQG